MKKLMTWMGMGLLVMGLLTACSDNGAVLTIGAQAVPVGEATFVLRELETLYEEQYGPSIWSQGFEGTTFNDMAKGAAIESITRLYISKDVADKNGIVLSDEEMAKVDTLVEQYLSTGTEAALKEDNISLEDVKNIFVLNAIGEKLMDKELVGFEVDQAILDEALAGDTNYQQIETFGVDGVLEEVTAQHVLIATTGEDGTPLDEGAKAQALVKAEEVLAKARDGVDFTKLVEDYSDDPGAETNSGIYTFYRGQMVPEFEAAAFTMEIDEVKIVESQFGYHIIVKQAHNYPDDAQIQSVEEYKVFLVAQYTLAQKQAEFDKLYEIWKNDYSVTLNEGIWGNVQTTYEQNQQGQ